MFWIVFALICLLILWLNAIKFNRNKLLPPGPWGIPIFGILPFMNKAPHIKFQEYYQTYGKICGFYVGQIFVVVLSDFNLIKEAFLKRDVFAGRPESFAFRVAPEDRGISTSEGNEFKQYKSFIFSTLKDFGTIRQHFEYIVKENAEKFVEYLKTIENEEINILQPLGLSIAQTYCQILLDKKLDYSHPAFKKLIDLFFIEQRCYGNGIKIFLPWTKKIPIIKKLVGEDEIQKVRKDIYEVLKELMQDSVDNYTIGSKSTFIHSWFTEEINRKNKNPNDDIFSKRSLLFNIDIIFSAGYETTTTTLRWTFLFLLKHPHIMKKIIDEIDDVIGKDRFPTLDDSKNLPYTLATIEEVHRCATIGPLGIPHKCTEDAILDGFFIPKSSVVYANVHAVHTNPDLFHDPYEFNPERFINAEGKFCKSEYVIPFLIGKRKCPGEEMASIEIFFYLTHTLQYFCIQKGNINDLLESSGSDNFSSVPDQYTMRFIKR